MNMSLPADVESQLAAIREEIAFRGGELVDLAVDLIRFETVSREELDSPPRAERELQEMLADRFARRGMDSTVWEPRESDLVLNDQFPRSVSFDGRPQLMARSTGSGNGRSVLFCGHIDVVPPGDLNLWTSPPFSPEIRGGRIYGRGATDMKGGIAAMVIAAEVLHDLEISPRGDLLLSTVTDEEFNGGGTAALVAKGLRADAAIVPEASDFKTYVCCHGWLGLTLKVQGRASHADLPQPDWRKGGAVNAITEAMRVVDALQVLEVRWRSRPDSDHPYLAPGVIVPTMIRGGEWPVTYPDNCQVTFNVNYLPAQGNHGGWGEKVRAEIEGEIGSLAKGTWLEHHPVTFDWALNLPAFQLGEDEAVVQATLAAAEHLGLAASLGGQSSWDDSATLNHAGIPAVSFGPPTEDEDGRVLLHSVDESVGIDDLVATAQGLACAARIYWLG